MTKITKDFFNLQEILFIGYSGKPKNKAFCDGIYQALTKRGIKVYPLNPNPNATFNIKVYRNFKELPKVPSVAYVYTGKDNTRKLIKQLKEQGIRKVLFQNERTFDQEILNECQQLGIEAVVGCPMLVLGSGFHKIHAFFSGVK